MNAVLLTSRPPSFADATGGNGEEEEKSKGAKLSPGFAAEVLTGPCGCGCHVSCPAVPLIAETR